MKVLVNNNGCDDTTEFEIEVDEEKLKWLIEFAKLNNCYSTYNCQPEIAIYKEYKVKPDGEYSIFYKREDGCIVEFPDLTKE